MTAQASRVYPIWPEAGGIYQARHPGPALPFGHLYYSTQVLTNNTGFEFCYKLISSLVDHHAFDHFENINFYHFDLKVDQKSFHNLILRGSSANKAISS
jgi:hypothetical protein